MRRIIIKGSDKSGHYGHRGRPGQVGGSQRGVLTSNRRISSKFFKSKRWMDITSTLTDDQRHIVEMSLKDVPANHLAKLSKITTEGHKDAKLNWEEDEELLGFYHRIDKSIHLNPEDNNKGFHKSTILHELGHHVQGTTSGKDVNILRKLYSRIKAEAFRDFGEPDPSAPLRRKILSSEGESWMYSMGLRPYSLISAREFFSDVYKESIYQRDPIFSGGNVPGRNTQFSKLSTEIERESSRWYPHDPPRTLDALFRHNLRVGEWSGNYHLEYQ